jgi:bifunctional enzyme CysN/CysC
VADYRTFADALNFETITPIPMSALKGDNVIQPSQTTHWYQGPTLMGFLETVDTQTHAKEHPLRFPVQWVNRPNLDFRGFAGTVEAGQARVGQAVRILPSGETATIKEIVLFNDQINTANTGKAVTITLDREVDASRGDIIVTSDAPCEVSDQFEVELVWMDQEPGYVGRSYFMQIGTAQVNAQITHIKHKININTFEKLAASKLQLNDLCVVTLKTDKAIPFEPYKQCAGIGGLILIDRMSNQTVAAAMINFALRRASNVHTQNLTVDKTQRNKLNGHTGKVLWFTGLSGSGKSTIANIVEQKLHQQGIRTYILDGDNVRHGLNKDLGFTEADRIENIRRITEVAHLMVDAGLVVLTAFISPFRAERDAARSSFESGEFVEIYVDTSLEIAEQRDVKGLYKKARKGEIPNFTGINSPYEKPENPDFTLSTSKASPEQLAEQLLAQLAI